MDNSSLKNPYLIEKYQNGLSFYEIYSDGKCKQGGRCSSNSITFLKEFKDTDYIFTSNVYGYNSNTGACTYSWASGFASAINSKTTSGIGFASSSRSSYNMEWIAEGYIK